MGRKSGAARAAARKARPSSEHKEVANSDAKVQESHDDVSEAESNRWNLQWDTMSHSFGAILIQLRELQNDAEAVETEADSQHLQLCRNNVQAACCHALDFFVERKQRSDS